MQRSMSKYRGSSKSRCSCINICVDAYVRVDVGGDGRRKNCLHVGLPVCLSLGWVVLAMVPPPVRINAKSTMMSLGIKMWMHMMMNMKMKIMVAMGRILG